MTGLRWLSVVLLATFALSCAGYAAPRQPHGGAPAPGQNPPAQPGGPPEMRIAAVVNDEVISMFDVISRMRLIMLSSNISDSPDARQRIAPQVLRSLIDERLELQEAKKQNITATDAEINAALEQIEKQNNMKSGQLNEFMKARGIDRGSLVDQLTASIVWAKLVRRQAAQTVEISDEEIDDALKRAKEHAKDPESRVAEIFLAVDNPAQEEEVRRTAERLSQQMHQGARFSVIARQFSQSATAAVGGDMGWVRPDQLPPELGKQVTQLKVGELSPPIRTTGGYYLLVVLDRRNGGGGGGAGGGNETSRVYDIVQVVFPFPPRASEAVRRTAIAEVESVRGAAKDCPTLLRIGKEKAPQLSSEGKLRENEISPEMRNVLSRLEVGHVSPPIVQKNGVGVIMICNKTEEAAGPGGISREDVAESLIRQRLDTVARRYLRDLRRSSYVDVRA